MARNPTQGPARCGGVGGDGGGGGCGGGEIRMPSPLPPPLPGAGSRRFCTPLVPGLARPLPGLGSNISYGLIRLLATGSLWV